MISGRIKTNIKRDIIDYNELQGLTPNDVLDLQDKIKDKLGEIEYGMSASVLCSKRMVFAPSLVVWLSVATASNRSPSS